MSKEFSLMTKRIVSTAVKNLWRNKYSSVATIVVMALILFIFNIILAINLTAENILKELNQKIDIIVYLKDSTDLIQVENMMNELNQVEGVKQVKYTSKQEALEKVLEQYGNIENPFNKFGLENKLPAHIQIITESPSYHNKILSFLQGSSYSSLFSDIESDHETQKIAATLNNINQASKTIGFTVLISFLLGGIIIILNAIHLTIYNRRQEIKIMKLVGAHIPFIRLPFIIEGMLLGLAAAFLNIFTLQSLSGIPYEHIEQAITSLQHTSILQMLGTIGIGSLGSLVATNKYLNTET